MPSESRDYLVLLAIGLLVLLGPAVIVGGTLGVLVLVGDLALGRISPLDFLELYVVDMFLFVALAYGVYRVTLWSVRHHVPESLAGFGGGDADSGSSGDS